MKIYPQDNSNRLHQGKPMPGKPGGRLFNTTDSFRPGESLANVSNPLKKGADILMGKKTVSEVKSKWVADHSGIVSHVDEKGVLAGGYNSNTKMLDPDNGEVKWELEYQGLPKMGKDGNVYIVSEDSHLRCIDRNSGKQKWNLQLNENHEKGHRIQVGEDGVLYADLRTEVVAVDPSTKNVKWRCKKIGDPIVGPDEKIFGGGYDSEKVTAFDPKTGEQMWQFPTSGLVRCKPTVSKDGKTVFAGDTDGFVYAIDAETGKENWKIKTGGYVLIPPAVTDDGTLLVGSCDRRLYALDPKTGREKWKFHSGDDFRTNIGFAPDKSIIIRGRGNNIIALHPQNGGKRWEKKAESYVFHPPCFSDDGDMYLGVNNHKTYAYHTPSFSSEKIKEDMAEAMKNSGNEDKPAGGVSVNEKENFVEIDGVRLDIKKWDLIRGR